MEHYNSYRRAGNRDNAKGTASIPGKDDDRKLFVGGVTRQTTDMELREYFSQFGEIESVTVKMDPYTGQSRGFAFIVFTDSQTIDKLLNAGDHYINQRKVDPKRVSKKHGKIFVGGLVPEITEEDIREFFSEYGNILEIQTPFDHKKKQRKGFCFITFDSKDVVYKLLKTPKQYIKGKEVDVKKVKVNSETPAARVPTGFPSAGWAFGGYPGGYYSDDMSYNLPSHDLPDNDAGNGYGSNSPQVPPLANKPKGYGGIVRQFQRHQPY